MATRRGKILFGIGAFLFGAVTFLLASAYLIDRGLPKWLAAIVGGLAFPVLPVVWHAISERRRTARIAATKTPPRTSLDPGDRYLLRAIAVALVVLGPMIAFGRLGVVRAAWTHRAWFIPEGSGSDSTSGGSVNRAKLLAHVPDDAEVVIIARDAEQPKREGVFAYGDHQLLVIAPQEPEAEGESIDDKIKEINEQREKIPFVEIDPVERVNVGGDLFAVASKRWQSKVTSPGSGPSAAIRTELDRAPAGAAMAIAFVPKTAPDMLHIKNAAAWLVASDEKIVVDGRVETVDADSGERLLSDARAAWNAKKDEVPEKCRGPVDAIAEQVQLERAGTITTFHVEVAPEKLMALMFCAVQVE